MPQWDSNWPCQPLVDSIAVSFEDNVAKFEPEVGDAFTRPRYSAGRMIIAGTLPFPTTQIGEFRAWFRDDLARGSIKFDMQCWITHETKSFKFTTNPTFQRSASGIYLVSMTIARKDD